MCIFKCIANKKIKKPTRYSSPCPEILELFTTTYTMHHKTARGKVFLFFHNNTILKNTSPLYIYIYILFWKETFGIRHPNDLFWYRKNILNYMEALEIKIIVLFLKGICWNSPHASLVFDSILWTGETFLCFRWLMQTLKFYCDTFLFLIIVLRHMSGVSVSMLVWIRSWSSEMSGTLKRSKSWGSDLKGLKSVSCCMLLHSIERKRKWQLANKLVL